MCGGVKPIKLFSNHGFFISFSTNKSWGYFTSTVEDNEGIGRSHFEQPNAIMGKMKQIYPIILQRVKQRAVDSDNEKENLDLSEVEYPS